MKKQIVPVSALALSLFLGFGAYVVQAKGRKTDAKEPAGSISLASVDLERIYAEAGAEEQLAQAAQEKQKDSFERIQKIAAASYLEPIELNEFGNLIGKLKPSLEEQKRLDALTTLEATRELELKDLTTKKTPTELEQKRLTHLVSLKTALEKDMPRISSEFQIQQDEYVAAYRRYQIKLLRGEVAKVAKDKGVANVFDSNSLVYAANDLTEPVVAYLKKHPLKAIGK